MLFAKVGSGAATQKEGAGAKFDIGDAGIEQFRNDRSAAIVGICHNRDCGGQVQDIERFPLARTQVEIIATGVWPAVAGAGETGHALEPSSVAARQKLVISAVDRIKEAGEFILRESWAVPFEPTPNGRALMWINSAVMEAAHHHATALQEKGWQYGQETRA